MSGRWFNRHAVEWVLYEAGDVPPHLLAAYMAVASFTGPDGKGAHPSTATVALLIRKADRNAKKDISELKRLKLLLPGDERLVSHIRADRRPNVYDLPMPRGVADVTPWRLNGVTQGTARGDAEGPDGVTQASPKKDLKRSGKGAARDGADAPPSPPRPDPMPCCGRAPGTGHIPGCYASIEDGAA